MNNQIPIQLIPYKEPIRVILKYDVLPSEKNFMPFSYALNEAYFHTFVGVPPTFVFIPLDTSEMSVLSIIEKEEEIIKNGKKKSLLVVSETDKKELLEATSAIKDILKGDEYHSDKEGVCLLKKKYPGLKAWSSIKTTPA